jgi:hypothetical protein
MSCTKTTDHYYVAVRPQTNEYHSVHREGCPFMPEETKRIYLGSFRTGEEAGYEGRKIFPRSTECRFCSGPHSDTGEEKSIVEISRSLLPEMEQIANYEKQSMFFMMN